MSTILEKLGWKSFITLLTRNSGGMIICPSSCISLLVQASILVFLIRVFLCSFNSCMSSCNPLMESLKVCYVPSYCALIRLDIAVNASNSFPISDHDTTLFFHLLLGVSSLRKAEFLSCPELLLYLYYKMKLLPFLKIYENNLMITIRNCWVQKSLC